MSKGIMAAMAAAFSAGILPIFTKLMQNAGATPGQVLVYRYLFVFLLTGAYFVFKRRSPAVGIKGIAALIFFSICGYGGSCFLLACAFNYLPIGLASMLYFTYPVFVMLIMTFIFRERPTAIKVL